MGGLRSQLAELEATLTERVTGIDRTKAELATFKARYRRDVGELHQQLDELEMAITEVELGEIAKQVKDRSGDAAAAAAAEQLDTAPRYTSDVVRRLFRDVAKAIHPDLAHDEMARDRRHSLMIEANRAYALGDEERLRWILQAWENSPEAVQGTDEEAARLRLVRRIAQIEAQLQICDTELAALRDTPVWKLKEMVDESAKRGKDLVADTVRRLKRDIMVARNRLDAIRPISG